MKNGRQNGRQKGSITIFGVLIMVLVAECLLVLLEGARLMEMKKISKLQTEVALEAAFANYCYPLWEEYHLLGAYQQEMESVISVYGNSRMSDFEWRKNLLNFGVQDIMVNSYTLLTDGQGKAYKKAVSNYMKDNVLYETIKKIYNQYEAIADIVKKGSSEYGDIDEALQYLEDKNVNQKMRATASITNPLQVIDDIRKRGILPLVIEDMDALSKKDVGDALLVSQRTLANGYGKTYEEEWVEQILMQQYLLTYMSSYMNENPDRGLVYELEYILIGKPSDVENLSGVVNHILGIRQAVNMIYLISDAQKMAETESLALLLAGASGNPVVVKLVQGALITAWAYGESVLDVRALMQGKRVPLLKSVSTWTLQLNEFGRLASGDLTAKESELGFSYQDYVGVLILFAKEDQVAMRSMDVQELYVRQLDGYRYFRMDSLLTEAEVTLVYEYRPVFDMFEFLKAGFTWDYTIEHKKHYQY